MDIVKKETPKDGFVKADTDETYENMSVSRAKEVCEELTGVDVDSVVEELTSRYNHRYVSDENKSEPPTYPSIKVDEDLVVRAIAGVLTEMRFKQEVKMRSFPSGTPDYNRVRDLLLRKEVGWLDTEWVLPDVKPYHPLQEHTIKIWEGEIERESEEAHRSYAKSFDGFEGHGIHTSTAKRLSDELGIDIDIKNGLEYKDGMNKWERRENKKEVFIHDLTS